MRSACCPFSPRLTGAVWLGGADDDEEQEVEAEPEAKKSKLKFGSMGKNPNVMTGFLPDRWVRAVIK